MASLVTSVIGGVQGASASHHAADYLKKGYAQAGQTVNDAVAQVNPEILKAAQDAGISVTDAAKAAGTGVTDAARAAGTGATTAADKLAELLNPYISVGANAAGQLGDAAKPFTADMMAKYSPAYQFQLQQGTQAANRMAAATGMTGAGGTMKALQRYTQDYAGTAFKNANDIYQGNFNRLATLANMGMGAASDAGKVGVQAAEYAGDTGMRGAEYAGTAGTDAARYAGTANINARNLASSNTLNAADYLANTQIESQRAQAMGDLGAASSWNNMLTGIGKAGDTLLGAGFSPEGDWSFGQIGKTIGKTSGWGKG